MRPDPSSTPDPSSALELIVPRWQAPSHVRAVTSTRRGGVSRGAFAGLNLGDHVGDDPARVAANRALLREALRLPAEPLWLEQVHGCKVIDGLEAGALRVASGAAGAGVGETSGARCPTADAAVAREPGQVAVVMTADCLPVLLCDDGGAVVAAAHAGWRGLLDGVIEATVAAMRVPADQVHAWLGPAIGPSSFEVGPEVRERFCALSAEAAAGFAAGVDGRWLADLYLLARQRLASIGVQRISGGEYCTFLDQQRFFSYRRDGRSGRMASLIWMEPPSQRPDASARAER
jgi:YfiH family protein